MKTFDSIPFISKPILVASRFTASVVMIGGCMLMELEAGGAISEPDNVIYGTIVIGSTPVSADQTDVVIEAQRIPGGEVVSSYRMGSDSSLGSFYALTLKMESIDPVGSTATRIGDGLTIIVKNSSGVVGTTIYQVVERGQIQRVDFGAPVEDADGNGIPDLWELTYLNASGVNPWELGANGQTVQQNYVAGTNPEDTTDTFKLNINNLAGSAMVSFLARRAEGVGYTDKTRLYTLESNSNGGVGAWSPVPGYIDVEGDNQTVAFVSAGAKGSEVFRGIARLAALQAPGSPRLTIQKLSGNMLRLSWPVSSEGFALEEASDPSSAAWSEVGLTASSDGTVWSVTINSPAGDRFYRLAK